MKCPMPSEAKFSPEFHEVRPATVPPHSFCQMRFPILRVSAGERLTAETLLAAVTATRAANRRAGRFQGSGRAMLDDRSFLSSVPVPAAPRFKIATARGFLLLMKRII